MAVAGVCPNTQSHVNLRCKERLREETPIRLRFSEPQHLSPGFLRLEHSLHLNGSKDSEKKQAHCLMVYVSKPKGILKDMHKQQVTEEVLFWYCRPLSPPPLSMQGGRRREQNTPKLSLR